MGGSALNASYVDAIYNPILCIHAATGTLHLVMRVACVVAELLLARKYNSLQAEQTNKTRRAR